ncbi:MAG TPA: hypothetical protein VFN76_09560 [Candidatus Limnocylindria bacterium]|nr:hypothetical protein [Candidatus Limnocylindria bacterium]
MRPLVAVPMQVEGPAEVTADRWQVMAGWAEASTHALIIELGRRIEELPPPSIKTWITGVAAGIGIGLAIAVVMTLS